ncbi:MAG: hypothetical protein ABUL58_05595 [Steroidobacter sp.]
MLGLAIAGCMPAPPLVLKSTSDPARHDGSVAVHAPLQPDCIVSISSITDKRTDPTTLGTVAGRPVHTPQDISQWLAKEFRGLGKYNVVLSDHDVRNAGVKIDIELLTAWVTELRMAKTANVVIGIHLSGRDDGSDNGRKFYRGTSNGVNWASGDAELQGMIDDAFGQIMKAASADIRTFCKAERG